MKANKLKGKRSRQFVGATINCGFSYLLRRVVNDLVTKVLRKFRSTREIARPLFRYVLQPTGCVLAPYILGIRFSSRQPATTSKFQRSKDS